jgi:hypothetical protein
MMDDDDVVMTPTRLVDIPAKFIHQAFEHLQHTNARHVTFMFANEMIIDAICIGINTSTRRALPAPVFEKPSIEIDNRVDIKVPQAAEKSDKALTPEIVFDVISKNSPINVRQIGDKLGLGSDARQRAIVQRLVRKLSKDELISIVGNGYYPQYIPTESATSPRTISRKNITEQVILQHLRSATSMTSRGMGDLIGIPRSDTSIRGKITLVMSQLLSHGLVESIGYESDGSGRVYKIVNSTDS